MNKPQMIEDIILATAILVFTAWALAQFFAIENRINEAKNPQTCRNQYNTIVNCPKPGERNGNRNF